MPVETLSQGDRLQLRVNLGADQQSGRTIYRSRSWSNVKPEVSDAVLHDFAVSLGNMGADPVENIFRIKTLELVEEE